MNNYCTIRANAPLGGVRDWLRGRAEDRHRSRLLRVAQVVDTFQFSRWDPRTLLSPAGNILQGCMRVQNPANVNEYYLVTCNYEAAEPAWSVWCSPFNGGNADIIIQAVQIRVERNRAARLAGNMGGCN